jgi:hypothetical protein
MLNIFSNIVNYLPFLAVVIIFILAIFFYRKKRNFWLLIWLMVGVDLVLALLKSIMQYFVWEQDGLTHILNNLPLKKLSISWFNDLPIFTGYGHGYFLYYAWNHFLIQPILSIVAAFVVYFICVFFRKRKSNLFLNYEAELVLLFLLLIGWPQVVIFLPLTVLVGVFVSIFNYYYKHQAACFLFLPLVISAVLMFVFSSQLAALRMLLFSF